MNVLTLVVAFLAVYGLSMLAWQIWHRIGKPRETRVPTVIVVVDQANDWIEWFIRKVSLELFAMGQGAIDILIVDVSSSLETSMIVSKLQQSYHFVTYVPSSQERRWSDVVALLQAAKRSQALLVEVDDERDVQGVIRMIAQLAP